MIEILSASYSRHYKPFHSKIRPDIPYYLFRFQHEGQCSALVADGMKTVKPGDLILCKPGDPCDFYVGQGMPDSLQTKCISADFYMFCRGPWLDQWCNSAPRAQKTNIPFDEGLLSLWKLIIAEQSTNPADASISVHLLQAFCLLIDRILHSVNTYAISSSNTMAAYQIKSCIEQYAASKFKLEEIANSVGLSVSRIVQLFKQTYNQTITEYANQIRLTLACKQICYSDRSLEEIAESVGFQSYSYFHRVFRARYGISPKQYRNQHFK